MSKYGVVKCPKHPVDQPGNLHTNKIFSNILQPPMVMFENPRAFPKSEILAPLISSPEALKTWSERRV